MLAPGPSGHARRRVVSGHLLFWVLIGVGPGPRVPHPIMVIIHLVAMMAHGVFGLVLMQTTNVIATRLASRRPSCMGASLLDGQKRGAGIARAFGEIPATAVMIILVRQWIRAGQREAARRDRAPTAPRRGRW
ncbi:cytochrome c oxidase assembly protein [Micromonospora sp. WMMD1219]|uniref:cytochrome c oxidase assembly protein n=1 Tax=Micromonospora sp. WMMD1219 TaxID=3404115 RepID=UPI003BF47DA9